MGPLLKWLMKDRRRPRRRFVEDDGGTYVMDTSVPDSVAVDISAGVAVVTGGSDVPQYCDTSSSATSFDSSACSPPPDTSSSTTF